MQETGGVREQYPVTIPLATSLFLTPGAATQSWRCLPIALLHLCEFRSPTPQQTRDLFMEAAEPPSSAGYANTKLNQLARAFHC